MPRRSKKSEQLAEAATAPPPAASVPDLAPMLDDDAAAEAEDARRTASAEQAVTFLLDGQLYGLPIEVVQEIQQIVEFTPLPDAAAELVGVIDLRGLVVPAVDLRVLVGLPARPFTLDTPMVFCRVRGHVVCLVVDAVEDVIDLPPDGLQPPSGLYGLADRMLGMCRLSQGLILMLDIDRLVPDAALTATQVEGGEDA